MKTNLSTIGLCIATGFAIAAVIEIGISSKETTVDAVVAINNATELNNFIKKNKKSVTEFYAPWCGFCKGMESSYREMAQKNSGVKFAKVDCTTDGGKKLAQDYKFGVEVINEKEAEMIRSII